MLGPSQLVQPLKKIFNEGSRRMKQKRLVIDEVIKWNRRKAKDAADPNDKERYEENVRNLLEYKEKM